MRLMRLRSAMGREGEMSAYIYARVSSAKQAAKSGLVRQIRRCLEYAEESGYIVNGIFSEVAPGSSDYPIRKHVEYLARLNRHVITCEDADRWSRKGLSDVAPNNVKFLPNELDREIQMLIFKYLK
jgi:predicted site-specific integrase-resolvase